MTPSGNVNVDKVLLKPSEVAACLNISLRTIWRWTKRGEMPAPFRRGRVTRWKRSDIEIFLADHPRLRRTHKPA